MPYPVSVLGEKSQLTKETDLDFYTKPLHDVAIDSTSTSQSLPTVDNDIHLRPQKKDEQVDTIEAMNTNREKILNQVKTSTKFKSCLVVSDIVDHDILGPD
jgi:uncharacterized membrane protein